MAKYFVVSLIPSLILTYSDCLVSQFTLLAITRKGNKPVLHGAAKPEDDKQLYDHFVSRVGYLYSTGKVKNGVFQAMMEVSLVNDGPVSVNYRSDNGDCAVLSMYARRLADVGKVTLEIETNPLQRDKISDNAISKSRNAISNDMAN